MRSSGVVSMIPRTRRRTRTQGRAALVALCCLATACGLFQRFRFERPSVELREVVVTGIGLGGGSLELVLDVYNPNPYALHTTRLEVGIDLEDTHFGDARLDRPVELPPQEQTEVTVPLAFTWEGVGAGARAFIARGSVRYSLSGRVFAATPGGDRSFGVTGGGTVSIRDLAR